MTTSSTGQGQNEGNWRRDVIVIVVAVAAVAAQAKVVERKRRRTALKDYNLRVLRTMKVW